MDQADRGGTWVKTGYDAVTKNREENFYTVTNTLNIKAGGKHR